MHLVAFPFTTFYFRFFIIYGDSCRAGRPVKNNNNTTFNVTVEEVNNVGLGSPPGDPADKVRLGRAGRQ